MSTTENNLGEATYTRVYNAPRELLFECMTTPEHLTHFWGPVGTTTPLDKISVDLRVGGEFVTTMVDDATGGEFTMRAVFVEIDPPARLVWSDPGLEGGMTTTVNFIDLGDGTTEVVTHQTNIPEMFRTPEASAGMQSSFDRFDAYVTQLAASRS